jgi:trans-2,3-dihydro-3-hydroxyanthranilate isomerase
MDVFTTAVGTGNPLAVVFGADGLDEARMQMIAREFNLSETTFIFSARPDKGVPLVRIFTPARELPFAGHPVIGTAAALANGIVKRTGSPPTAIDFEVPAGLVHTKISVAKITSLQRVSFRACRHCTSGRRRQHKQRQA